MEKREFVEAIQLLDDSNWKPGKYKEPSISKRSETFYQFDEGTFVITWEIEIIYSSIWTIPVLYFRGFTGSGEGIPVELEQKLLGPSPFNISVVVQCVKV
jgi:hypothetical protein